jgi:hypothetical protein
MSRLRARALAAAVLAAAFAAAGSAHPVDKFHEIPVDDPAYRVVPGPGAGTGWDAAPSAVDAAVDAWSSDAASAGATGSRAPRLTDVAPEEDEPVANRSLNGGVDNAGILARASSSANASHPHCAACDGCSVDWGAASLAAQAGADCRGHGACGACDLGRLGAIDETYSLKRLRDVPAKRDTGASAATVIRADLGDGKRPFVKFVCIPGLPRHSTVCEKGAPRPAEDRLVANTRSLQRLSDFCGLERVSTRSWVAHVTGVAPAGLPLDPWNVHPDPVPLDQLGIFSSPADGIALSALCGGEEGPGVLMEIPSAQVVEAALFDFVFCAGDRHTQNVFVDEAANIRLIDNDNLLGEQVFSGRQPGRECAVSSLFLPGTMESWRLRRSKYCKNRLGSLDYRCHVGPSGEVRLKPQLERCLTHFARTSAAEIQSEFGLLELAFARTLKARATDLVERGFPEALRLAGLHEKNVSLANAHRYPTNKTWDELEEEERSKYQAWRDSMWRPTEPAVCRDRAAKWEGADWDYRADDAFEGGAAWADDTGAQMNEKRSEGEA